MKTSAKELAVATLASATDKGNRTAARGLVDYLKKHHQIKLISQILVELTEAASAEGTVSAKVYSAKSLADSELKDVRLKIKETTKADQVNIENIIDKDLIGGIKITFQDKVIDQTIKNRINQLRLRLSKTA